MLPILTLRPELRCTARSRRSGWQQCGRLAAYGSRVCTTHGARKTPRFGKQAPNYKHGLRSEETIINARHTRQRLKNLAKGVELINAIPATANVTLNPTQKAGVANFLIEQAALKLRQEEELASIEFKKQPIKSRRKRR